MKIPRVIAALIEKTKSDFSGLTKWEHQKLENHALELQASDERVVVPGRKNNRAAKRAKKIRKLVSGAFGKVAST